MLIIWVLLLEDKKPLPFVVTLQVRFVISVLVK